MLFLAAHFLWSHMSITEVVNMVTAFAVATGPVAVTVGVLGHALVASKIPFLQRVGKILEGIGLDMKRVSEAFKDLKKKDPPDDPPSAQKPAGLSTLALALVLTGCGSASMAAEPPDCSELTLTKIEAAYLSEAALACRGYGYDDCPELPAIRAKYQAKRREWQNCG